MRRRKCPPLLTQPTTEPGLAEYMSYAFARLKRHEEAQLQRGAALSQRLRQRLASTIADQEAQVEARLKSCQ